MKSLLIAILFGAAVLALAACTGEDKDPGPDGPEPTVTPTHTPTPTPTPTPMPTPTPPSEVVSLNDSGGRGPFAFEPADLNFSVGETVTLTFKSETQFHTFTVDDLGIDVSVDGGTTETFTFIFDKPGTYDLICIPHEALGMTGTIAVR